ncbi:MAG: PAS domain S-box protein [Deltaproteobacteria bacterium]|nr:PAS domain S-box protein [Deltaproteobacteria bacterium]
MTILPPQTAGMEDLKAQWEHAWEALQKAYDDLEQRIEERTAELMKANAHLVQEIEERQRTENELQRIKEYLENVIDNSVDAIGIVDQHARFILWNRRAAEIYGYHFHELAGKTAFDLYANPADLERMLIKLRHEGVVREYEIAMKKRDGSIVPMDISISLLKDEQGATIGSVCVARDLSDRKKNELELKRARDELSRYSRDLERQIRERTRDITSILRYTPAVVCIKDRSGHYKLVNPRYEKLLGLRNEDIQGKTDHDIFPLELADRFRATDLKVLQEKRSLQVEERIPLKDGSHIYLSVKFPLYDECGNADGLCGMISTDITELKKAQEQLRLLSGSIMDRQEKERAAIARELHDELGQVLTALRMDAVWLGERLKAKDTQAAARSLAMCDLIDTTIDEVRALATRLRPGLLDDFGLIDALDYYTKYFGQRTGITCIFKHLNMPQVDDLVATAAYRITQEALTNVARHAFATKVKIDLQVKRGVLTLSVADNGRGFNPQKLSESDCLGLAGMRERASLLGGSLELQSQPGKGTRVYFRLPLDERRGALP